MNHGPGSIHPRRWFTGALLALACAVALASPAAAALPAGNLILNPGAEATPGSAEAGAQTDIPQWTTSTGFEAVPYELGNGFPDTVESDRIHGETNFFSGGANTDGATASQDIDVSGAAAEIDAGGVTATLDALLGGYADQSDSAAVTATFLATADGAPLGDPAVVGPVTVDDREGNTRLDPRTTTVAVPAGTRTIRVTITATRVDGAYNDGYADNLSLTLATGAAPAKHPTTTSIACDSTSVPPGTATSCTVSVRDDAAAGATRPSGTAALSTTGTGTLAPAACTLTPARSPVMSTCAVTFNPGGDAGTRTLGAAYAGDATHAGSSGAVDVAVPAPPVANPGPVLPSPEGIKSVACESQTRIIGLALVRGCLVQEGKKVRAVGTVFVNGLVLRAAAGTGDLIFDPANVRLIGSKPGIDVGVYLPNPANPGLALVGLSTPKLLRIGSLEPTKLKDGTTLLMRLSAAGGAVALARIAIKNVIVTLKGVVVKTGMVVRALANRVFELAASASAPSYLGQASGELNLRISATAVTGSFKVPAAYLGSPDSAWGAVGVKNVDLAFDASKEGFSWDGSGIMVFGPFELAGKLSFDDGGLREFRVDGTAGGTAAPLLRATMNGYVLPGIGWAINGTGQASIPGPTGTPLIAATGVMGFLKTGNALTLRGSGSINVLNGALTLGGGAFELSSAGSMGLSGATSLGTKAANITAQFSGWATRTPKRAFNLEGSGTVHVLDVDIAGGALVSSTGFGACASMKVTVFGEVVGSARVGFGRRWGQNLDVIASSCDLGPYRASAAAHAAAGGERTVDLPAGLPSAVLAVHTATGTPRVKLTDPQGHTSIPQRGTSVPAGGAVAFTDPDTSTQYVLIARPGKGRWTVAAADGAPAIASVRVANGLPDPAVRAKVQGRGARRTLRWTLTRIAGQTVRFIEEGKGIHRQIAQSSSATGSVAFTPAPGAGKRTVTAIVEQRGLPRASHKVASFTATVTALKAPAALSVRRKGAGLAVRWNRVPGAARYRVHVTADGRSFDLFTAGTTLTVPSAGPRKGRVVVRAIDGAGHAGAGRTAAFR